MNLGPLLQHGGIRLTEGRTSPLPFRNAAVPTICTVPLKQHVGLPATPLVKRGDTVREGMLIGRSDETRIHAPIPGIVRDLRDIVGYDGTVSKAVVIELNGEFDRLGKKEGEHQWRNHSSEQLQKALMDRGVVGMGGEGYPSHLKYAAARTEEIDLLVINALESDPYMQADLQLIRSYPETIIEGAEILERIVAPRRVLFAFESRNHEGARILRRAIAQRDLSWKVKVLPHLYPRGDEKILLQRLTGREVPSGGTSLDVNAVVANASTAHEVYEAVVLRKPVIERVVTVAGGAIRHPANLKVRLGMPIQELIAECGGFTEMPDRIVINGVMRGHTIEEVSLPVTKTTKAILALTEEEVGSSEELPCIQCGRCIRSCPVGLNPMRLYKLIEHGETEKAVEEGLMECRECGVCAHVCPSRIPLVERFREAKRIAEERGVL
ncbi:MAG: electron transport complex subunit RsxC [Spirochaetaceae bacterium]